MTTALRPLLIAILAAVIASGQEHIHPAPQKLGKVQFANSCNPNVQPVFNRAVALLHSFQFGVAIQSFNEVLREDPSCTIAYWGIALSEWGNPMAPGLKSTAALERGRRATRMARARPPKTEREHAYMEAVGRLYEDFETTEQGARLAAYESAMERLAGRYSEDREAQAFYALALSAAADPADKTYAKQLKAGAILERLFVQQPDHPGLAHYIIHAYDVPPLAPRAVAAARRYASIAPDAPHALHMPSHTFTRVGSWQESINTNILSAAAAKRAGEIAEELHASDYQMYAYLQSGQDAAALRLLRSLPEIRSRFRSGGVSSGAAPSAAGVFALAAIPARFALERSAWTDAANIEVYPSKVLYADAIAWFARGIGAARSGDNNKARIAADRLAKVREELISAKELYWAGQVRIEQQEVLAWIAFANGRSGDALQQMRAAVATEDATEKSAVTPGPIAPAREMLAEMLLELRRPSEAQREFATTLAKEPNRFRALSGAAKSAAAAGDAASAQKYRQQLLEVCARGDRPGRPELESARRASQALPTSRTR